MEKWKRDSGKKIGYQVKKTCQVSGVFTNLVQKTPQLANELACVQSKGQGIMTGLFYKKTLILCVWECVWEHILALKASEDDDYDVFPYLWYECACVVTMFFLPENSKVCTHIKHSLRVLQRMVCDFEPVLQCHSLTDCISVIIKRYAQ